MKHVKLVPLALLCSYTLKLLFLGTSLSEMGAIFALVSLCGAYEFLDKSKRVEEIQTEVKKQIEEVRATVAFQNDVIQKMALQIDEAKTGVTAMRLAQGMTNGIKRSS